MLDPKPRGLTAADSCRDTRTPLLMVQADSINSLASLLRGADSAERVELAVTAFSGGALT